MDDNGASLTPIFLFNRDKETFRIHRVNRRGSHTRRVPVQWRDLVDQALGLQVPPKGWKDFFWFAAIIMELGEAQQRQVIERIGLRNSRNITLEIDSIWTYVVKSFNSTNAYRKIDEMETTRLIELLKSGLEAVRTELKYPAGNPAEVSYEITDEVIRAATTERCRQTLERLQATHKGPIFPDLYQKIKAQIEEKFPEESAQVLMALEGTGNREHLAAISLTSEDDELCVSLVNIHGQKVRMAAWNFVNLLENPEAALRLADLTPSGYREQKRTFVFNQNKKGKVVGKFTPARSTINIVCLQESDNSVCDNGTFVIDIDYALCVYAVVKRLREDKERFDRLKELAENTIEHDPFDAIYQSMEVL